MTGWLIYTEYEAERNKNYIQFYIDEGKQLNIDMILLIAERIHIGIKDGLWFLSYEGKEIKFPSFAICRMMYPLLTRQLEYMGIPVFNNSKVSFVCNDKARTYQHIAQLSIPMVDTIFGKKEFHNEVIKYIDYPSIIKTTDGHGGKEVYLIEKKSDIKELIPKIEDKDIVIQPYISKFKQDLRVYVIGTKIIACVLRTAKEGYRSNYSLGGKVELYELTDTQRADVNKIIQLFDFGLVGIDFMIGDQGELLFNEIEDVVGSRMLYQTSTINIVQLYLQYIVDELSEKNKPSS